MNRVERAAFRNGAERGLSQANALAGPPAVIAFAALHAWLAAVIMAAASIMGTLNWVQIIKHDNRPRHYLQWHTPHHGHDGHLAEKCPELAR